MSEAEGELEAEGFVPPEPPITERRGPGRPKGSRNKPKDEAKSSSSSSSSSPGFSQSRLVDKLAEPIQRIGQFLEDKDPELAQALKEDARKMALLLGRWAASPKCPPGVVAAIRFVAVVLEPIDAFGRTARLLYVRLRDRRRARAFEGELVPFPGNGEVIPVPEGAELEGEQGGPSTPDRFRADREPPAVD